jgi:hypothetical protein
VNGGDGWVLEALAHTLQVSEEYMKQPSLGPERWLPHTSQVLEAIRNVGQTPDRP